MADRAAQEVAIESTAPSTEEEPADDLQAIDGIGPGLESRLLEYGIRQYKDLAAMDDEAAAKLGTQLELDEPGAVLQWVQDAKEFNR